VLEGLRVALGTSEIRGSDCIRDYGVFRIAEMKFAETPFQASR